MSLGARPARAQLNPVGRLGWLVWRTLTSVRFAVLQISLLAVSGVIGTVLPQLPAFSLHDPAAYAQQMAGIEARYEAFSILGLNVGPGMVDVFERLGFFRVFSAPWFILLLTLLVVSIIVCTLDRTPNLWRTAHKVKVAQAAPLLRPAPVRAGALRCRRRGRRGPAHQGVARQALPRARGER